MNENDEGLVMFSWNNYFISSIQQGIQAGHCWVDMAVKYSPIKRLTGSPWRIYWNWAENHKTVNVRNGGDELGLIDIIKILQRADNPYPYMEWREDKSQRELMTSVSIIIPESVYAWEAEYDIEDHDSYGSQALLVEVVKNPLTPFDQELYNLIKSTRHAT